MSVTNPLTQNPVPVLLERQLDKFTHASIQSSDLSHFDSSRSMAILAQKEGARIIGADFGGDKGQTQLFVVQDGSLVPDPSYSDYVQGDHGAGYLASLEKTAVYASEHNIPVGISWGAPLDGTRPIFHPKAKVFFAELAERYDNDFANVVPTLSACYNDGPAGLISGLIEANRQQPTSSVLFPINGGGIGMAAFHDSILYAVEAGHVEGIAELNRYNQDEACGVYGADYTCLERFGANKVGIEAQWLAHSGSRLRARDIEDRYKAGDMFAGELYDNSALVLAHVIQGTANVFGIDLTDSAAAVVGHGGAFKFPYYGERVLQILEHHNGAPIRLIMTKDYGSRESNACLDGAALAAVLAR